MIAGCLARTNHCPLTPMIYKTEKYTIIHRQVLLMLVCATVSSRFVRILRKQQHGILHKDLKATLAAAGQAQARELSSADESGKVWYHHSIWR